MIERLLYRHRTQRRAPDAGVNEVCRPRVANIFGKHLGYLGVTVGLRELHEAEVSLQELFRGFFQPGPYIFQLAFLDAALDLHQVFVVETHFRHARSLLCVPLRR